MHALPETFVDDDSFKDFNTSFDTDDPLGPGNYENDYISSIEQITDFMNNTSCNEEETNNALEPIKLVTKANANGMLYFSIYLLSVCFLYSFSF